MRPSRRVAPEPAANASSLVTALLRDKAAFVDRFAPQLVMSANAVRRGDLRTVAYRTRAKQPLTTSTVGTAIGDLFDIYYGYTELENKAELGVGDTPVISSSGTDNSLYGFFDFPRHSSRHSLPRPARAASERPECRNTRARPPRTAWSSSRRPTLPSQPYTLPLPRSEMNVGDLTTPENSLLVESSTFRCASRAPAGSGRGSARHRR